MFITIIRMQHSKNVFIVLMLITCFTSIMLISVSHCLRLTMLSIENFVIFLWYRYVKF